MTPESEALNAHLFLQSKEAVVAADAKVLITHFNPAAVKLFRMGAEQAVGDRMDNLLVDAQREAFRQVLGRFFLTGDKKLTQSTVEVTAVRGQGTPIRCELSMSSFTVKDKPYLLAIFRDVTERKKAAAKLHEAQKMEIMDRMAGEVAHDINNLLVGVQGHTALLKIADTPEERTYSLSEIDRLVKRGAEIMKELRAFARSGGTKDVPMVKAPMELNTVVKNTHQILTRTFPSQITLKLDLADELPTINADANLLEQVVMNLALNSRDAMPGGGVLSIHTQAFKPDEDFLRTHPGMPKGNLVRLTVSDTGSGIAPDILRRVFEPFFTTKEKQGNAGLGLTMAWKTVKDHGGYIGIDSEPGTGTTVQIYFPAVTDQAAKPEADIDYKIVPGTGTLLLIEDETYIRETTSKLLTHIGYKVHVAPDGDAGIKVFDVRRDEINLVVIDMKMPGKNGLETFQVIKQMKPDVLAILTTGYSVRGDTDAMFRLGLKAYIMKPYNLAELSTKISTVLGAS